MVEALYKGYRDVIENLGWNIYEYENNVELEIYTDAGEDFIFSASNENFFQDIWDYAFEYFDPDEHVEMWIEAKRNGRRNVPSIRKLVEDADWIEKSLEKLADALNDVRKQLQ